jgi:hypothetical protein
MLLLLLFLGSQFEALIVVTTSGRIGSAWASWPGIACLGAPAGCPAATAEQSRDLARLPGPGQPVCLVSQRFDLCCLQRRNAALFNSQLCFRNELNSLN